MMIIMIIQPQKSVSRLKGIAGFQKMYDIMGISQSLLITAARKTMKNQPENEITFFYNLLMLFEFLW